MKISEVYQKFMVPPNLAEHMRAVVKVVNWIKKRWKGDRINWNRLIKAAWLHDLGNIVKFNFDNNQEYFGYKKGEVEKWKELQKEIINKYGDDDHEVTRKMLEEIGVEKKIENLILDKSFSNSIKIAKGNSGELKILLYADLRISPRGLVSLKERLNEVIGRSAKYKALPNLAEMIEAAEEIESQIQKVVVGDLAEINLK